MVDMLSELGYRVLKAKDAESALAIVESGVPIDLLFTDVVMPGALRSPELARRAQERLPDIAVLFTSGYTENAIVHGGRLDEGIELLSKPYSREALARKIRHVLRNQQQRSAAQSPARAEEARAPRRPAPSARRRSDPAGRGRRLIRFSTGGDADEPRPFGRGDGETPSSRSRPSTRPPSTSSSPTSPCPACRARSSPTSPSGAQPDLRVIFATGYEIANAAPADRTAPPLVLQKPYDEKSIAGALVAAMSAPGMRAGKT